MRVRCQVSGVRCRRSQFVIHNSQITIQGYKRPLSLLTLYLLFTFYFSLLTPRVAAHAELLTAVPAPGASLDAPPAEIRLTFSEPIGSGSDIFLFTEGFQYVDGLDVRVENDNELVTAVPADLPADTYSVQWTAVSADGHSISGTYTFVVNAPPQLVPFIGGVVFGLVTALGIIYLLRRRRKPE